MFNQILSVSRIFTLCSREMRINDLNLFLFFQVVQSEYSIPLYMKFYKIWIKNNFFELNDYMIIR